MVKLKSVVFSPEVISGLYKVSTGRFRLFTTLGHDLEISEEAAQEILNYFEEHKEEFGPKN